MGTDHFLGEIVVPLREVEEVDGGLKEADIRRYILGRRSAKDKVGRALHCQDWHCQHVHDIRIPEGIAIGTDMGFCHDLITSCVIPGLPKAGSVGTWQRPIPCSRHPRGFKKSASLGLQPQLIFFYLATLYR